MQILPRPTSRQSNHSQGPQTAFCLSLGGATAVMNLKVLGPLWLASQVFDSVVYRRNSPDHP